MSINDLNEVEALLVRADQLGIIKHPQSNIVSYKGSRDDELRARTLQNLAKKISYPEGLASLREDIAFYAMGGLRKKSKSHGWIKRFIYYWSVKMKLRKRKNKSGYTGIYHHLSGWGYYTWKVDIKLNGVRHTKLFPETPDGLLEAARYVNELCKQLHIDMPNDFDE